jgi:FkbM family methyltransferase
MNVLYGLENYYSLFGLKGLLLALKSRVFGKTICIGVRIPGLRHLLHLRLRNSDVTLLRSVFLDGEYDWSFLKQPRVIVDAGANVGFTSVLFANRYGDARIIAIEPESSNCDLLRKNAAPYPQIEVVQAALWKENTKLRIDDPGFGNWAFRTNEVNPGDSTLPDHGLVDAITLEKILADRHIAFVDLLKVDIEGSEKEVFDNSDAWIGRVGVIVIELHDSFKAGCTEALLSATRDFSFERHRGETTVRGRNEFGGLNPNVSKEFETLRAQLNSSLPFEIKQESLH